MCHSGVSSEMVKEGERKFSVGCASQRGGGVFALSLSPGDFNAIYNWHLGMAVSGTVPASLRNAAGCCTGSSPSCVL